MSADLGGDSPCWAHELSDDASTGAGPGGEVVVDLGWVSSVSGGAVWSLPHGGDLDANLVRLDPNSAIGAHVNAEVDVLMFVQSGSGRLAVDGAAHELGADHVALVPKGAARAVEAGPGGMTYLSVHRRRAPMLPGVRNLRPDDGGPAA